MSIKYYALRYTNLNYLKTVVSPTTKLHKAILVIEWKPRDVYFACTFENTRWYVMTCTVMPHYHICLISTVKFFISAVIIIKTK